MSGHRVDLDELDRVIGQLEAFEKSLRTAMTSTDAQVNALHHTWSGDAARAHAQAHRHWREGTATMTEALRTMHRIARTAHGNYHAAVTANVAMWRR